MTAPLYFGIDVSKHTLDVGTADRYLFRVENTAAGHRQLMTKLEKIAQKQEAEIGGICVESTGCYSRDVVDALFYAKLPVSLVPPSCVRHFARSKQVHAKTDAIDSRIIALYCERIQPRLYRPASASTKELRGLLDRRDQVIDDRVREQCRLEARPDPLIAERIQQHIHLLKEEEQRLDQEIAALVKKDEDLNRKATVLLDVSGIGLTTTALLLAYLPELGTVNRQHINALAGLAPYDNSSGKRDGKRRVFGGRKRVREGLYMASLSAVRFNSVLSQVYTHLLKQGKCKKVALMACARKMLVHLNTLLTKLEQPDASPC